MPSTPIPAPSRPAGASVPAPTRAPVLRAARPAGQMPLPFFPPGARGG